MGTDFEVLDVQDARLDDEALAELQKWVGTTEYDAPSSEFRRHLASRALDTGRWITQTTAFQRWYSSTDGAVGSLWIKGVPGSGKSVIAAAMVDHLTQTEAVPVLFFFFRYIIAANRTPRSLIKDWLAQLLPHSVKLQGLLLPQTNTGIDAVPDKQLWNILLEGLVSVPRVYCIVDALDEMDASADGVFPRWLNELAVFRPDSVKLLLTSRPKPYLQRLLTAPSIVRITLQQDLVGKDIAVFVAHRLALDIPDQAACDALAPIVTARSQGLFLYARLLLDQIVGSLSSVSSLNIAGVAESIPVGLEEMYDSILHRQAQMMLNGAAVQQSVLSLVTHASRPMRLSEISDFVAHEHPELVGSKAKEIARVICSPLLEILEDETVQVIHHSFTEFLLGSEHNHVFSGKRSRVTAVLISAQVHRRLALSCLKYLQSGVLRTTDDMRKTKPDICFCGNLPCRFVTPKGDIMQYDDSAARLRFPFLEYAISNWAYHATHYDHADPELFAQLDSFIDPSGTQFRIWQRLGWPTKKAQPHRMRRMGEEWEEPQLLLSKLHVAAFAGLTEYARSFDHADQLNRRDDNGSTPLSMATIRNHGSVVSYLLGQGADFSAADAEGVPPLFAAVQHGHVEIAKMLLEAGADIHLSITLASGKSSTAFDLAAQSDSAKMVAFMIPYASEEIIGKMLCSACSNGSASCVRELLDSTNVSPDTAVDGRTALYRAAEATNVSCVEMLLDRGADVNLCSTCTSLGNSHNYVMHVETALNAALRSWSLRNPACMTIAMRLLDAGVDINCKSYYTDTETPTRGFTALLQIIRPFANNRPHGVIQQSKKHLDVIRAFLDKGADVLDVNNARRTALHLSLRFHGSLEEPKLLLDRGANLNAIDKEGNTVWHLLFENNKSVSSINELVQFLLEYGAGSLLHLRNNTRQSQPGVSGLRAAANMSAISLQTFELLLTECHDADARGECLEDIGHWPSDEDQDRFLELLVANRVDLEWRNAQGQTPLLQNVSNIDHFNRLLSIGAQPHATDNDGRGVLHHFVSAMPTRPRYRVRRGPSSDLQPTRMERFQELVERFKELVELGLDPLTPDSNGCTLVHEMAKNYFSIEHGEFVYTLLDMGVPLDAGDARGRTALHLLFEECGAMYMGNGEKMKEARSELLPKFLRAANIDRQDATEGLAAIHHASMDTDFALTMLLAAGANPLLKTHAGESVLHLACRARACSVVWYLLRLEQTHGLRDAANSHGRTALHLACRSGEVESVRALLKSGASVHAHDEQGRTPLHACAELEEELQIWRDIKLDNSPVSSDRLRPKHRFRSDDEFETKKACKGVAHLVSLLVLAGADPQSKDHMGHTPLDLAIHAGCSSVAQILQAEDLATASRRMPDILASRSQLLTEQVIVQPIGWPLALTQGEIDQLKAERIDLGRSHGWFHYKNVLSNAVRSGDFDLVQKIGFFIRSFDNAEFIEAIIKATTFDNTQIWKDNDRPCGFLLIAGQVEDTKSNIAMIEFLLKDCGLDANTYQPVMREGSRQLGTPDVVTPHQYVLHALSRSKSMVSPTLTRRKNMVSWFQDAIAIVVENGADSESKDFMGMTALHHVCRWPGIYASEYAQTLLDLGADPNAMDNQGQVVHRLASRCPALQEIFAARGASIPPDELLMEGISGNSVELVKVALDGGADANAMDVHGTCEIKHVDEKLVDNMRKEQRSALFCASMQISAGGAAGKIIDMLIERGADLLMPISEGRPLLHILIEYTEEARCHAILNHMEHAWLEMRDCKGRTPFLVACERNSDLRYGTMERTVAAMTRLVELGADTRAVDNEGRNGLHHLLRVESRYDRDEEDQDVMELLDGEAAKHLISQNDLSGHSPLHYALNNRRFVVCEKIVALGGDLSPPDPKGASSLHCIAAQYLDGRERTTMQHGSSRAANLHNNGRPWDKHYEVCQRLWQQTLALGVGVDDGDNEGNPPLFHYLLDPLGEYNTAQEWNMDTLHIMRFSDLFAGADVHVRNKAGETALHIVARCQVGKTIHGTYGPNGTEQSSLFRFIANKGLDPLAEDNLGRSSLDVAAGYGKQSILDLFQFKS